MIKKIMFIMVCAIFLLSNLLFAVDGLPEPKDINTSSIGFGVGINEYSKDQDNYKTINGVPKNLGGNEIYQNKIFTEGTYSFKYKDTIEKILLRIGTANMRIKDSTGISYDSTPFESPFITIGMSSLFYNYNSFGLGAFTEFTYNTARYVNEKDNIKLINNNMFDIKGGLIAQYDFDNFKIYGGPAIWARQYDFEYYEDGVKIDKGINKEKTSLGAIAGTKVNVMEMDIGSKRKMAIAIGIETEYRDKKWGGNKKQPISIPFEITFNPKKGGKDK